jgi:hypothetical protein
MAAIFLCFQEGVLKCHAFNGEQFVKEMRLEDFIKEYNTLLLKYNVEKNKDYWERLNSKNAALSFYQKDQSTRKQGELPHLTPRREGLQHANEGEKEATANPEKGAARHDQPDRQARGTAQGAADARDQCPD